MMSKFTKEKLDNRMKDYKSSFSAEECRKRRENSVISISKQRREDNIYKRRNIIIPILDEEDDTLQRPYEINSLQEYVEDIKQREDLQRQLRGIVGIRKLISVDTSPPIDLVIQQGSIPYIISLLRNLGHHRLQFEAAWVLTNIASGTSTQILSLVQNGAIMAFMEQLESPSLQVREQAIWALGNLSGDKVEYRDIIIECGLIPKLILQLQQSQNSQQMLRTITWTLSNLCRGSPQPSLSAIELILPWFCSLLNHDDTEVISDSLWGLSFISSGPVEVLELIINRSVCRKIVELSWRKELEIKAAALKIIGNFVSSDLEDHTNLMLNLGVLSLVSYLLSPLTHRDVCKDACWIIGNIAAGSDEQLQQVIDSNVVPQLIQLLSDCNFHIKFEALVAISNICNSGTFEHIRLLVGKGCLEPVCSILKLNDKEIKLLGLTVIENILITGSEDPEFIDCGNKYVEFIYFCEGFKTLEHLLNDEDAEVSSKALDIIDEFFSQEEEIE